MSRHRRVVSVATAVTASLLVAAGTPVASAQRAGAQRARGEPISLGFISLENSPVASFPESREAAEAAVEYVNRELGGVDGHPIELLVCKASGTPETSSRCANRFVEEDVVAVTGGADLATDVSLPILEQAGIPLVGLIPGGLSEYTSADSYLFVGGTLAELLAAEQFIAQEVNAKKVTILYADIPAGALAAETFGRKIFAKLGISDVKLVPEDQNAPDFTSALNLAVEDEPDVVLVQMAAQACAGILDAKRSLGIDVPLVLTGGCLDRGSLEHANDGDYFSTEFTFYDDTKDREVKIYRRVLKKYAARKTVLSMLSQAGFSSVVNLHALFGDIGFDNLTSKSLIAALDATRDEANFMAHPYTCDRKQMSLTTAVCNSYVRIMRYREAKGSREAGLVEVSHGWVSAANLMA